MGKRKGVFDDIVNELAPKFDELNKYFTICGMPVAFTMLSVVA